MRKSEQVGQAESVTIQDLGDRKLVRVGNLGELVQFKEDLSEEPRMSAEDIARRLERDPSEVRRIARGIQHKKFQPFLLWTVTGKGKKGFEELWLNEAEALYLVMHLRGPKPDDLKWEMAEVYIKARRGLLGPPVDPALISEMRSALTEYREEVKALRADNAELKSQFCKLEKRVAEDVGKVSAEFVKEHISEPFARIAMLRASKDSREMEHPKKIRSHLRAINNEVRNIVCHNGKGSAWTNYPRDVKLIEILKNVIKNKLDEAIHEASEDVRLKAEANARTQAEARLRQLGLFDQIKTN